MGRHWSSRYWIFATTKRTLCVSSPLVVTHVDRPLPAQMLILSVWLSPVCRSAPAGFQTADIFLHLRDAARSASGERPWPGSRCWRTALDDFLASAPPR